MAAACKSVKKVVLTGPPGIGKTTVVKKICEALKSDDIKTVGFYTEEILLGRNRIGFDFITLDGQRGPLARIEDDANGQACQYKVGRYNVQLTALENTALPTLKYKAKEKHTVYVIDEVGKMELFSQSFQQAVRSILEEPSATVLATIPIARHRPIPFVEQIRNRKDARFYQVSKDNRNTIVKEIVSFLQEACKN